MNDSAPTIQTPFTGDGSCTHDGINGVQIDYNNLLNKPDSAPTPTSSVLDPSSQFIEFLPWNSLDGWTTGGSGTIYPNSSSVSFVITGGGGGTATLAQNNGYAFLFETGKAVTFDVPLFYPGTPGVAGQTIYILLTDSFSSLTGSAHVGFKFLTFGSTFGPANLYGTTSDGSGETQVSMSGSTFGTPSSIQSLRLIYTPGTDCKFYLNGTLAGTITTHLPATTVSPRVYFGIGGANASTFNFGRILLTKQY